MKPGPKPEQRPGAVKYPNHCVCVGGKIIDYDRCIKCGRDIKKVR